MKSLARYKRITFVCLTLLVFVTGLLNAAPVRAEQKAAQPVVEQNEFLNTDGTLKLDRSYSGALDLNGWDVRLDPRRGPVFAPAQETLPPGWSGLGADPFGDGMINGEVEAIAINGDNVYVGGIFKNVGLVLTAADYIAKWDGTSWSALGSNGAGDGALNGGVDAIEVVGDDIYVGGYFTDVNNKGHILPGADHIARWDGTNWSSLGTADEYGDGPINRGVNAMAAKGGILYVTGDFTDVVNNGAEIREADYVAKWDGMNWSALGSNGAGDGSFTEPIRAIAVDGNDVYVGGNFLEVNNNGTSLPTAAYIAKWDGTNWSALGSNGYGGPALNGYVAAIAASNGVVYAGGGFTDVKNNGVKLTTADYIARWDGTNWSSLGSYMGNYGSLVGSVNAIAIDGNDIYVGGWFVDVRDNTKIISEADDVARWDGMHWHALGSDGEGDGAVGLGVWAIAVHPSAVYVGGVFDEVNSNGDILTNAAHIAVYVEENPLPATPTFSDVPTDNRYYRDIEILYANRLTGGCSTSPLKYCPDQSMNRGEAAVFMLRGSFGSSYVPTPAVHIFKDDWTKGTWAEHWAESMYYKGLSAGCSSSPLKYCPWDRIPREQAVIFALRMKYGMSYVPPPATGTLFADMTSTSYYATSWAEQAYKDGLIPNCGMSGGKPKFCPKVLVSRGLAAYMIVRAKNLTMP
jgi:hypothetical protein